MRILILSIFALLSGQVCLYAQTEKTEVFLKPEDLGMHKYVWEFKPKIDEIVVFHRQQILNGKTVMDQEEFDAQTREGQLCTKEVLIVDEGFFRHIEHPGEKGHYQLNFPGGGGRVDGYELHALSPGVSKYNSIGPVKLSFVSLRDPKETMENVYSLYVAPYATLKQRYPDMPSLEELRKAGGWGANTRP